MRMRVTRRHLLSSCGASTLAILSPRRGGTAKPPLLTYDLVRDFGARPGTTPESVVATTQALIAFHKEARKLSNPTLPGSYPHARWDNRITLNIPAGVFRHGYNRFGMGIKYLTLRGAGKSKTFLQNCNTTSWYNAIPFRSCGPDYFNDPGTPLNLGYYIDSVEIGATSVLLKSSAHAAALQVGKWVLIMSLNRQLYGWPPAMSRYDWARVMHKTGRAIELDRPLTFSHADDSPSPGIPRDGGSSIECAGPGAIVPIDTDAKPVGELHLYEGFAVLPHPSWRAAWGDQGSADVFQLIGCIEVRVNDCDFANAVGMTQLRSVTLTDCNYRFDESDKIVGLCNYVRCQIIETVGHTQQLHWTVQGGNIGAVRNMSAVRATLQGVTIMRHLSLDSGQPTDECILDGVIFAGGNQAEPITPPNPRPYTFVVGKDVELVGPTKLRAAKTGGEFGQPFKEIATRWGVGHTVNLNGSFIRGSSLISLTADLEFAYAQFAGVSLKAGDRIWVAPLQRLVVRNCLGRGTRHQWYVPFVSNIPEVVWEHNSGD